MTVDAAEHYDNAKAKRNAVILALAQALFGAIGTAMAVTAGLIGSQLAPTVSLATMPVSVMIIGTAVSTFPISLMMRRIGRRAGFIACALVGFVGALIGLAAIILQFFSLFLAGCALIGVYQASASYYRFAAADLASPAFRPKAISWVLTGGILAAVAGSAMVMKTVDLFAPITFAGTWAAMAVISLVAALLLIPLDIPTATEAHATTGRPLAEIATQPRYIVAALSAMLSYGIMVLVMTATPVAMLGCGFTVNDSAWVIQWHAIAMFLPSFFTGHLIVRFGAEKIAAGGMLLLVGAAISGLMGIHFENFAVGLILLGLGWNFGFLGGTTLLTTTYEPAEKNKAQGLNDLMVFCTNALASLAAGMLLAGSGWNAVNYAVFPMVALALVMIGWLMTHRKATPVA